MCRFLCGARSIFTSLLLIPAALTVNGQTVYPEQLNYVSHRTNDSIIIDGRALEASWQKAPWSEVFGDIEGSKKPRPTYQTKVKMLWNDDYLFIFAELEEPHIQASLRKRDTIIYHDNDFEVFIDPNGDTHQYYEIEVNAYNTILDLFMGKPYRNGGNAMITWNAKGLKSAVHHQGTINKPGDKDTAWTVEMAIPFSALGFYNWNLRPQENTRWRINFSRVQWDWDVVNGSYVKRKGKNGRPLPEHNWVWSPQGIIDMHAPERWGNLWFRLQDKSTVAAPAPEDDKARLLLWEVYYKQQQYRRQKGKYAASLQELGLPNMVNGGEGKQYDVEIEAISRQFTARVALHNSQLTWSIDQEGRITNDK